MLKFAQLVMCKVLCFCNLFASEEICNIFQVYFIHCHNKPRDVQKSMVVLLRKVKCSYCSACGTCVFTGFAFSASQVIKEPTSYIA